MRFILDIIKGVIVGIANIIPGVSGGTMAVTMGIFDRMIEAINGIIKNFKKSFISLLPIGIGMVLGIGIFSFILPYCLKHYSFQTSMCFIGLIVGGIPAIITSTNKAFDKELANYYASRCGVILTAEEHSVIGGLGSAVCEAVCETTPCKVIRLGINDEFGTSASAGVLVSHFGLDAEGITAKALKALGK